MPPMEDHVIQAQKNKEFFSQINGLDEKFAGWGAISLFYTALHWIDASLAVRGGMMDQPEDHQKRNFAIRNVPVLRSQWSNYRALKDASEDARYKCRIFRWPEIMALEHARLTPLETHVRSLIGR